MEVERSNISVLTLVALVGFILGLAAGQVSCERSLGRSRIEWPSPPHPRSLQP